MQGQREEQPPQMKKEAGVVDAPNNQTEPVQR
jgi:hypothetical protein